MIGAGWGGLSAAYDLSKQADRYDVTLVEMARGSEASYAMASGRCRATAPPKRVNTAFGISITTFFDCWMTIWALSMTS